MGSSRSHRFLAHEVPEPTPGRGGGPLRSVLVVAASAATFAAASLIASRFADGSGASYFFPPAAVMVVAGAVGGWWGLLGVLIGHVATPWGAGSTGTGVLAFTVVHGVTTAICVLALHRPHGGTPWRLRRVVVFGAGVAQASSAALGVGFFVALGRLPLEIGPIAATFGRWLVADVVAVLVLGVPALVLISPPHALGPAATTMLRSWRRDRKAVASSLVLVALVLAAAAGVVTGFDLGFPHWMAVLLVAPVSLAGWVGGVGAAILTNGIAVIGWMALCLVSSGGLAYASLEPLYATVTILAVGAIVGGLAVGANRLLLDKIRAQQRDLALGFDAVVSSLSAAIEAKDPLTDGHLHRVANLAVATGRELGLTEEELTTVRYAALLHDIGKIGVPESILNKPGPLSAAEREKIEEHVTIGVRILQPVGVLAPVLPLVRYHQERWDGLRDGVLYPGYYGLVGEQIPLGARILAAVDAWDAMTNDRPYRLAMTFEAAQAEVLAQAGHQFDPAVVAALLRVVSVLPDDLAAAS